MKPLIPFFVVGLSILVLFPASAQDAPPQPVNLLLTAEAAPKADLSSGFSSMERMGFIETSPNFDLHMVLEANNDKQFGSDTVFLSNTNNLGNYFLVDEGYLVLKGLGFQFQAGRYLPVDEVNSPYSLFLNSQANSTNPESMSQYGMTLKYKAGPFTYSSEWIQLNYRSNFGSTAATPPAWQSFGTGFPDRGTDIHNFIFHSGDWRFGFQDQSIYSQRNFDPEYFFSPVPQYFTQYLRTIQGRPWTTGGQDKYQMGLFIDWKQPDRDAYVQLQMADFNLHFLDPALFPNNPGKFAWSLGGHVTNDWGRWGIFHAGATKFMYEPLTMGSASTQPVADFGNFYYPDTQYSMNGSFVPINLQANEIGYTNGENNLALMATWDHPYLNDRLKLGASLEFLLAGNNSPANPWQDTNGQNEMGTQMLTDPVLEKSIKAALHAGLFQGPWTFALDLTFGEIFNVLQLQTPSNTDPSWSPADQLIKIWKGSDQNQGILTVVFAVKYSFDATPLLNEMAKNNAEAVSTD